MNDINALKLAAIRAAAAISDYDRGRIDVLEKRLAVEEYEKLVSEPANVLALVEALEKAQRYIERLREWNAGLAQESCEYQNRIAELDPRTVTVKLPDPLMPAQHNSGELFMTPDNVIHGGYLNRDDVLRNLRAAGIQVIEGEGQ